MEDFQTDGVNQPDQPQIKLHIAFPLLRGFAVQRPRRDPSCQSQQDAAEEKVVVNRRGLRQFAIACQQIDTDPHLQCHAQQTGQLFLLPDATPQRNARQGEAEGQPVPKRTLRREVVLNGPADFVGDQHTQAPEQHSPRHHLVETIALLACQQPVLQRHGGGIDQGQRAGQDMLVLHDGLVSNQAQRQGQ